MATFNITKRAFARERIQITSGAVKALTPATYDDSTANDSGLKKRASCARIVLDSGSGDIHFSEEGTDPTTPTDNTGVGSFAGAGDQILLESYQAIRNFKSIALTATNAQGEVVYYR